MPEVGYNTSNFKRRFEFRVFLLTNCNTKAKEPSSRAVKRNGGSYFSHETITLCQLICFD